MSHLDLLRHIDRTLRRAGIPVVKSEAVNRHPRIYLSAPLGVGIRSLAEFGLIDTPFAGDFAARFNRCAPAGVRCVAFRLVDRMVNVVTELTAAEYAICGIAPFDPAEILTKSSLVLTDKRGRTRDVRDRIVDLRREGERVYATLRAGESSLRPDVLGEWLASQYGGSVQEITKVRAYGITAEKAGD